MQNVVNFSSQEGQSSSLRLGLSAIPDHCSHVLVLLADQPLISASLINRFVAIAQTGCELACLSANNYLGPPALFALKWFRELSSIRGDSGARRILNSEEKSLHLVSNQFQGQELDLDRPEDKDKLEDLLGLSTQTNKGKAYSFV